MNTSQKDTFITTFPLISTMLRFISLGSSRCSFSIMHSQINMRSSDNKGRGRRSSSLADNTSTRFFAFRYSFDTRRVCNTSKLLPIPFLFDQTFSNFVLHTKTYCISISIHQKFFHFSVIVSNLNQKFNQKIYPSNSFRKLKIIVQSFPRRSKRSSLLL